MDNIDPAFEDYLSIIFPQMRTESDPQKDTNLDKYSYYRGYHMGQIDLAVEISKVLNHQAKHVANQYTDLIEQLNKTLKGIVQ